MKLSLSSKRAALRQAVAVRRNTGKGLLAQLTEAAALRRGPGRLGVSQYYDYGLYDDGRFTRPAKLEFMGEAQNYDVDARLNHHSWIAVCSDKLLTYAVLAGFGVPTPRIHAVYHPDRRGIGGIPCLATEAELAAHLRSEMPYPFFAKPISMNSGRGASAVTAYDRAADRLVLAGGQAMGVEAYIGRHLVPEADPRRTGFILQEWIQQHPEVERICGRAVATVRMAVLLYPDGPRLFRAVWRIPVGQAITDNYEEARSGNLAAWLDTRSGTVERVSRGAGLARTELATHPDSGAQLLGFRLPGWERAVGTCLDVASQLRGLRFQHWDVAFGPDGPVVLEINSRGGSVLLQGPGGHGLMDDEFRAFLAAYGAPRRK